MTHAKKMKENYDVGMDVILFYTIPLKSFQWKKPRFNVYKCISLSGITYLLVYRTDKYKKLKAEVEKESKKCKCILLIQLISRQAPENKSRN